MTLHDLIQQLGDRPHLFFTQREPGEGGTGLAILAEPLAVGGAVVLPALRGADMVPVDDIIPRLVALAASGSGSRPVLVWTPEGWHDVVAPQTDWLLVAPLAGAPPAVAEADILALLGELRRVEREVAEGHPNTEEPI